MDDNHILLLRTARLIVTGFTWTIAILPAVAPLRAAEPGSTTLNIRWETVGPRAVPNAVYHRDKPAEAHLRSSGKVNAFLIHPTNPSVMYLAGGLDFGRGPTSNAGVYKSQDGGKTWVPSSAGLNDTYVCDLWMSRENPNVLLAGTAMSGIYRSTDSGGTWRQVHPVAARSLTEAGGVIYAATGLANVSSVISTSDAAKVGVAVSRDMGATWALAPSNSSGSARQVAASGNVVYAGLGNGAIWKKEAGSDAFVEIAPPPAAQNADLFCNVATNPRNPLEAIIAVVPSVGAEILQYMTRDGGKSWSRFGSDGCHTVAFDPNVEGRIYLGINSNLQVTEDGGTTWQRLDVSVDTRTLHTFSDRPGWVALGSDHGLYLSTNGGRNWQDLNGNLSNTLLDGMSVRGSYLLATVQDYNPIISSDGGASWREIPTSRENGKGFIHPTNPQFQYLLNRAGNGFQYSADGGANWTRPGSSGLPAAQWDFPYNPTIQGGASDRFMAVDPRAPEQVYVATRDGIYFSSNFGTSFSRLNWPMGSSGCILVDQTGGILVGARSVNDDSTDRLWVSRDRGVSWIKASAPVAFTGTGGGYTTISVSVNPGDERQVALTVRGRGPDAVLMSTDGGTTFRSDGDGLRALSSAETKYFNPSGQSFVWNSIAFAPLEFAGLVAVATVNGIYAKIPGKPWTSITGDGVVQYFTQVAWDAGYLYASTYGHGILRTSASALFAALGDKTRIDVQPVAREVTAGGSVEFSVQASGSSPLSYQWQKDGQPISGATAASYAIPQVKPADAGFYSVSVASAAATSTSEAARLAVNFSRLTNLSVLAPIATPGDSFTVGYVIGGAGTSGGKNVVARAVGPSLTPLGVAGAISDPKLERFAGATKTGENDNWGGSLSLSASMSAVGAFALSGSSSRDAAVTLGLNNGDHSIRISGVGNATGQVLAEVYDATPAANFTANTPRLLNLSVLKESAGGLIVGFVIAGAGERRILIRVVGPTLGTAFGIPGVSTDPRLTLFNGAKEFASNDNWGGGAALAAAFSEAGAFVLPAASSDAALVATLGAGNYSARVDTPAGSSGVVLVEIYELPF